MCVCVCFSLCIYCASNIAIFFINCLRLKTMQLIDCRKVKKQLIDCCAAAIKNSI